MNDLSQPDGFKLICHLYCLLLILIKQKSQHFLYSLCDGANHGCGTENITAIYCFIWVVLGIVSDNVINVIKKMRKSNAMAHLVHSGHHF